MMIPIANNVAGSAEKGKTVTVKDFWEEKHKLQTKENLTNSSFESTCKCLGIGEISSSWNILVVGVGTGRCTRDMYELGCKNIDALDISELALENVKGVTQNRFLSESDLPENNYDLVYSLHVAQHMSNKHLKIQLYKLIRSLKPSGLLAIQFIDAPDDNPTTSREDSEVMQKMGAVVRTPEFVEDLVNQCGASVIWKSKVHASTKYDVWSYVFHARREER